MLTDIRKPALFVLMVFNLTVLSKGQDIRIGLLSLSRPYSLTVNVKTAGYQMRAADRVLQLRPNENILITKAGQNILLNTGDGIELFTDSVLFVSPDTSGIFTVRNNLQPQDLFEYTGSLVIKSDINSLLAINQVDINSYLMGVVQAEAGFKGSIEYYKTQALLARTYMNLHSNKHERDEFNLCDRTHCQAYKGRSLVPAIKEAVIQTHGSVLTDKDSVLVFTPFHSNCGGQTESPDNVWLSKMAHLERIIDPYCFYSRNAKWTRRIRTEEWVSYLSSHGYNPGDEKDLVFQQLSRKKNYTAGEFSLPLTKLRNDWGLRSAFFTTDIENDYIVLNGRGYGHGVGLCQEGAMVMAERGFKMKEIINFYFKDLVVIDEIHVKHDVTITDAF